MPEVYLCVHSVGIKRGLLPPGSVLRVPEDMKEESAAALLARGSIRKPNPDPPAAQEAPVDAKELKQALDEIKLLSDSLPPGRVRLLSLDELPAPPQGETPEASPAPESEAVEAPAEAAPEPAPGPVKGYAPPPADQEVVIVGRDVGGLPFAAEALNPETKPDLLPNHRLLLERDGVRVYIAAQEPGPETLKAAALKEICQALDLDANGKRADLLERVRDLLPSDD